MVMNFSEVEMKVREATSDEPWGPHGQLMMQIADYTFTHNTYLEVMCTLWRRLYPENSRNWRRVYKSLVLLDFLLKNGSENVAAGAREHIYDIRTLESFQFIDDNGKDQGINVRIKVQEVINLIQDSDKLKAERAKAKGNRNLYIGYGGSNGSGWSNSHFPTRNTFDTSSYSRRCDENDFDDYDEVRPKYSDRMADLPPATQPARLGKFEDWQVGRERGVVDDVVEQIKEVWDTAKMVTKDLFIRKDSETHTYEDNPRMVSEEMYEFPSAAVDADGIIEGGGANGESEQRSQRNPDHTQKSTPESRIGSSEQVKSHIHKLQTTMEEKSCPPVDLIGSWEDARASNIPTTSGPVDLLGLGTSPGPNSWPTTNTSNVIDAFWPSSSSGQVSRDAEHVANSLLDTDFGEFVTAGSPKPKAQPVPSFPDLEDFDTFSSSVASQSGASGLPATTTNIPFSHQSHQPVSLPFQSTTHPVGSSDGAGAINNKTGISPLDTTGTPKSEPKVGSTWKELDKLRIDLDSLGRPNKIDLRAHAGPSLRQLQQQKSPPLSPPPHSQFPLGPQAALAAHISNAVMKPASTNTVSPSHPNQVHPAAGGLTMQDFSLF
ncbi:clathrin interactor 1 [Clonorchis sinensis]|uniref:Clathrin interactor 1 n=1 Tax=Clonorchis sinensis TaxID=79923 RepID=H2KQY9_CLOSI|nr:clathrin interactor 1 [Clonorchis sinensis]